MDWCDNSTTAADVALRMLVEDVPEAVAAFVNAEYDDEYIVADGDRFVANLSSNEVFWVCECNWSHQLVGLQKH